MLLKGGHALDAIAACDTVAFDKTGTLTTGQLTMRCIQPIHTHASDADQSLLSVRVSTSPSQRGGEGKEGEGEGVGKMVECQSGRCEMEAVAVAAALEQAAVHPIARCVPAMSVV